jgi:peptidyl-prolyl cis-trans isomerase C
MKRTNILAGCVLLSLLFVAGCNKENKSADNSKPAAVVNGQSISSEQIQAESEKLSQGHEDQAKSIANLVLKNAIDQELLAQEAVKAKVDETPKLQWELKAARRQLLAQAELETITRDVTAPTDAEIKSYYDGHPELFAHHKIYQLVNLIANTTPENIEEVRALAQKGGDVRTMAAAIQAKGIQVGGQQVVKRAEELPKDLLEKFSTMKAGQALAVEQGGKLQIVVLQDVQEQPVSFEQAKQSVGLYLTNDKKKQLLDAQLNKIRGQAKIEYNAPYSAPAMLAK